MKVQCPSCRDIVEMAEFSTSAAGLRFVCPACGASNFIPAPESGPAPPAQAEPPASPAPPAEAARPADAEEIVCPKCGHAQHDPYACHRCGLVFDRFDPASLPPDPLEARQLWEQIERRPGDEELHERFIHECSQLDRLDYATRQYRVLARRSGNREVAERMLARVAELGQARLPAPGPDHDQARQQGRTLRNILWVIVLVGLGLLAYLVFHRFGD